MTAPIALVVARAADGTIGHEGKIPWRIPADMLHFKAVTLGKPCVMGRKTWESLPKKPLPRRTNIVVTRDRAFAAEGTAIVHSFAEAIARAEAEHPSEIAIIGGADLYREALPQADRVYLTEVQGTFDGDVRLPPFDPNDWQEAAREDHPAEQGIPAFSFVTLERRAK
nr:Dihydrofolate reductase [uncultured bacterium]